MGKTKFKVDAKRNASTLALQETLKGFVAQKEVLIEKREELEETKLQRGGIEDLF